MEFFSTQHWRTIEVSSITYRINAMFFERWWRQKLWQKLEKDFMKVISDSNRIRRKIKRSILHLCIIRSHTSIFEMRIPVGWLKLSSHSRSVNVKNKISCSLRLILSYGMGYSDQFTSKKCTSSHMGYRMKSVLISCIPVRIIYSNTVVMWQCSTGEVVGNRTRTPCQRISPHSWREPGLLKGMPRLMLSGRIFQFLAAFGPRYFRFREWKACTSDFSILLVFMWLQNENLWHTVS